MARTITTDEIVLHDGTTLKWRSFDNTRETWNLIAAESSARIAAELACKLAMARVVLSKPAKPKPAKPKPAKPKPVSSYQVALGLNTPMPPLPFSLPLSLPLNARIAAELEGACKLAMADTFEQLVEHLRET